jgi:hypothetical protein
MILYKRDTAFFDIKVGGASVGLLNRHVKNIVIVEEVGKTAQGTINFLDRNLVISNLLHAGSEISIEWGYKSWDMGKLLTAPLGEWRGGLSRTIRGFLLSPGGGGDTGGNVNLSFEWIDYKGGRNKQKNKTWTQGTRHDAVRDVLESAGCIEVEIDFEGMNQSVSQAAPIRQDGTDQQTLVAWAREWNAIFSMGQTTLGIAAVFISASKLARSGLAGKVAGAYGNHRTFEYMTPEANVISFDWKQNIGENGAGDKVTIYTDDHGEMHMVKQPIPGQTTITYVLDQDAVNREMKTTPNVGELVQDILTLRSLRPDILERFFKKQESTTAGNGIGYEINLQIIGDQSLTATGKAKFGGGMPGFFFNTDLDWIIRKVTHTISEKSYLTSVNIADAYSANGGLLRRPLDNTVGNS